MRWPPPRSASDGTPSRSLIHCRSRLRRYHLHRKRSRQNIFRTGSPESRGSGVRRDPGSFPWSCLPVLTWRTWPPYSPGLRNGAARWHIHSRTASLPAPWRYPLPHPRTGIRRNISSPDSLPRICWSGGFPSPPSQPGLPSSQTRSARYENSDGPSPPGWHPRSHRLFSWSLQNRTFSFPPHLSN